MKAANNLAKALEPPPRSGVALGNRVRAWGVNPWGGLPNSSHLWQSSLFNPGVWQSIKNS